MTNNTVLTFYVKTMAAQGLWPLVAIWPEHLNDKQYAQYLRANELYLAIQTEVSLMDYHSARIFWSNHVPTSRPFPLHLFTTH